jgi:hypothetical protein
MVLLDYPDSEGVTRELSVGRRGRRITGKRLLTLRPVLVLGVSAILGLAAILVSQTVFRATGTAPAPDVHLPVVPFPTASASPTTQASASPQAASTVPPSTVSLSGSQLTPSIAPALNTGTGQNTAIAQNTASGQNTALAQDSASATAAPTATSAATSTQQAPAVTYVVVAQADGGFQFEAEVRVVNNGSAPISDWQITVALPDDQITAIGGASGYVSNHILLMQPEPGSSPLEPGSALKVFFEAQGPEMTPQLCAFGNTTCG